MVLSVKQMTGIICLAVLIVICASYDPAQAWWNEDWQYRNKIGFDTSPTGADIKTNLTDIPVLIRLHSGNFNFANTAEMGEDIRFVAADDKTLLKHHIEKYDPLDEVAYIWVKAPRLSGGVNTDFIWMYYGNKSAAGGQDSAGAYDANQVAVYHLSELEGGPRDAGPFNNHISDFSGGQGLPAVIAGGMAFSGGDRLIIAASPSLAFTGSFTFSAWIRISQPQQAATLFHRKGQGSSAIEIQINGTQVCLQITDAAGQAYRTEECLDLPLDSWRHVAFTAKSNDRMDIYLDSLLVYYRDLPVALPLTDGPIAIAATQSGDGAFIGDLDEIQLANVNRNADWVRAAFKSQGAEGSLVSVGPVEMGDGSGAFTEFYMTTVQVVRHITLDGWVIIGTLFVMGAGCLIVFMNKAYGLWLVEKENKTFVAAFAVIDDPLASYDSINGFSSSSLYRLYSGGCDVFKTQVDGSCGGDNAEIKAFKAALEKSYIEEGKRLNAWMLMLTMSITGGPFLGLLGTVWGVMSTFAAMAEAGEANIAAIAPGVASALATTVAGLLVAIPALFAYNYLLSRIKDITADMMVFIDQFTLKIERLKGVAE